ncbi:enolase-phosphatase E1 isoform X13 [Diorhabda sublineata]|uniref:enolase-phosphatase E1 isoform X13 n=2 Tax=Diorhabda sublineata TaxID=1163346 RepID=UPI0024E0A7B3|nr:enolase-phosphatase E1 isoform X13 [Diorhabda sublineata]
MADTVKKSRIVSEEEENLEEALLEEFNMRLKNCMSKDDLQEADQYPEENFYENISNNIRPMSKIALISNDFIENERQHYYDTPAITFDIKNGDSSEDRNDIEEEPEHLYETLPEPTKTEMTDQNVEKTAPETLNLNLNPEIEMDFTDEYEMVENDKPTFSLNTTDFSDIKTQEDNVKSVKDRMLLTSDDAATLLFTQTVTSPMLTPSEENIDFLKGFQRENTETSEESNDSPPKEEEISNNDIDNVKENIYENLKQPMEENIYENLKDVKDKVEELEEEHIYQDIDDDPKDIYEPVDVPSKTNVEEDVMIENILYNEVDNEEEAKIIVTDLDASENSVNDYEFVSDSGTKLIEETVTIEESIEEFKKEENLVEYEESSFEDKIKETYTEFLYHSKTENNYYEKYAEVMSKNVKVNNREKDTETVPPEIVKNLKSQFQKGDGDVNANQKKEIEDASQLKMVNIIKQINKFELKDTQEDDDDDDSTVTETYTETTTIQSDVPEEKVLKKKKTKKSRKEEKENISVCRSFGDLTKVPEEIHRAPDIKYSGRSKSMIDVLLSSNKKNIENVFSEVSVRALKEKFNIVENRDPLGIVKPSFKNMLPKSSFSKFDALQKKNVLHIRSSDSSKAQEKFNGTQIDTTNCKACSKQVFQMEQIKAEKAVWHKNCFRCTECSKQLTVETYVSHEGNLYCKPHFKSLFAPKVVEDDTPTSDKPDLGLEELQSLNVKERFQVFQQHQTETDSDRNLTPVNVKKSPSILSKLARFQAKGMDVGVTDEALNGIPIEESSTEEDEDEEDVPDGEDPTLYRAKKVQREKPFHFTNLNEVKNKWEQGEQTSRDERREERKQEIQSIRNKLFLGKQGKMKEAYQQAVMQSESCANLTKAEKIESCDTKSLKERFEKGELINDKEDRNGDTDETEVFQSEISKKSRSLFLELDANAAKQPQTIVTVPKVDVKKVRENDTPDREIYHDPEIIRSNENVDDSEVAKASHTASKMLSKFREMEENRSKEPEAIGPKPLKRFTPPPEPVRSESESEEGSASEDENEEDEEYNQGDNQKLPEELIEAQKAARAKQLRAKFEKWEAQEIKREQNQAINIMEEYGDDSQIESTKSLTARFESMRETSSDKTRTPRVKVNRFVEISSVFEQCESCKEKVYPLEKISVHGHVYHKRCFKCMECSCVLRMDSYSYNKGLLYCTPHFKRLFISKGNYDTGFGFDQHKEKWNNVNATMA